MGKLGSHWTCLYPSSTRRPMLGEVCKPHIFIYTTRNFQPRPVLSLRKPHAADNVIVWVGQSHQNWCILYNCQNNQTLASTIVFPDPLLIGSLAPKYQFGDSIFWTDCGQWGSLTWSFCICIFCRLTYHFPPFVLHFWRTFDCLCIFRFTSLEVGQQAPIFH